jgi:hypothetical protein
MRTIFCLLPLLSTTFAATIIESSALAGTLIAVDSNRSLYVLDPATGAKTPMGMVAANAIGPAGMTRDPATGIVYLATTGNDSLFRLDLATGGATLVGGFGTATIVMRGLEWDSTAVFLYGASNGNLFAISPTTGFANQIGTSGLTSFTSLAYDATVDVLYAANSGTHSFYTVNRTTGAVTFVGPLGTPQPADMAFDTEHHVLYVVDNATDMLLTIDPTTGAATPVGSTGPGDLLGLVFVPTPVTGQVFCSGDGSGTLCPCANSGNPGAGCASSVNQAGARLAATGFASILTDTLVLHGSGMPESSALYFQGTTGVASGMGSVFGDGLRCAGGSVIRLGTQLNVAGASQYPAGMQASVSVKGMCMPSDFRTYQVWYRNAAAFCTPSTFNLTNGLSLTWTP